jgi:uncharacterized membrane protein (DUF4010 family)
MTGGLAGLLEAQVSPDGLSGLIVAGFLLAISIVMLRFGLMEARAQGSFSATTVIAGITTYGLGALAVVGEMTVASAAGAVMVTVLASREFLHGAIRRLTWAELRSAVILLAMSLVLLPLIPGDPYGPFGGVAPRSLVLLVILLASISFIGYVAVRLVGGGRGDLVAGAVGGLVSSTATTLAMARQSKEPVGAAGPAAGAIAAGGVSLVRTGLLLLALAPTASERLLPGLLVAGAVMLLVAVAMVARKEATSHAEPPGNPFELLQVVKMALLITAIAFLARAASQVFGDAGLYVVSGLTALADVDAVTVTVAGMMPKLSIEVAVMAIGIAVAANLLAKVVYAGLAGSRGFALRLASVSLLAMVAGFVVTLAAGLA